MGRKPVTIGLVVLALVLASGNAAAQTMSGSIDASGSAYAGSSLTDEAPDAGPSELCPPEHMCAPGSPSEEDDESEHDAEVEIELSAEFVLELLPNASLEVPAGEEPAPSEAPEDDEPAPDEEPEDEPEESVVNETIETYFDSNTSIEGNVSYELNETPAPTPPAPSEAPEDDEPAPDDEPDEEGPTYEAPSRIGDGIEATVESTVRSALHLDVSIYEELRRGLPLATTPAGPAEPAPAPMPIEHELEAGENGSAKFSLRGAFEATTGGFTDAFASVTGALDGLVQQLRGAARTEAAVESATEVEVLPEATGSVDIAAEAVSNVETVADAVAVPEIAVPTADVSSESEVESETRVSSDLTGDSDLGL